MDFSMLYIPKEELYCLAVLVILAVIQIAVALKKKYSVKKLQVDSFQDIDANAKPSLSVIVYADKEIGAFLNQSIPAIFNQNYNDYEVIIVNADSSETVDDMITILTAQYPKLKSTFIPDSICNVSIRKLATMLGVKAAANDVVIFTDANCIPLTDNWLASMARKFSDETGVVIGYATVDASSDTSFSHRYRVFDKVEDSVEYLLAASSNHAFRGDRMNIAYRKELFFDNKGFSRTMNMKYGDDDIFIRELSELAKVKPELSEDSIVKEMPVDYASSFVVNKLHRAFTMSKINPGFKKISWVIANLRVIYLILTAVAVALSVVSIIKDPAIALHSIIFGGVAIVLFITDLLVYLFYMRNVMDALKMPKLLFTIPLFREIRPFVNLYYKMHSSKIDNYTWER